MNKDITKDPYYEQLKEIQEKGVLEVGYFMSIFKDKNFYTQDIFHIIINKITPRRLHHLTRVELQNMVLYEYLFKYLDKNGEITEITLKDFKPLAKYFSNYKEK